MLPSARAVTNLTPRWWLACNYEPLAKSEDGLAWQIRGPGVQAMTEDQVIADDGSIKDTGTSGKFAQRWADLMTSNYEELSNKDKVFGDLRNIMDMCVVAALIKKEGLATKAKLNLSMFDESSSPLELVSYHAPKSVASQCSMLKKGSRWIITASGGVEIDSWSVASNADSVATMATNES